MKVEILDGQTIFDIAKQEYGNVECVWQLVDDNPAVITSLNVALVPGSKLNIQADKTKVVGYAKEVVEYLKVRGSKLAGGNLAGLEVLGTEGGDYLVTEDGNYLMY